MKRVKLFSLIVFVAMTSFCASAQEQGANTNGDEKIPVPEKMEVYGMAGDLIRYGYQQQSALPLIQAAQLLNTIGQQPLDATKETEGEATADSKGEAKVSYDLDQILADATELAAGNDAYLAIIDQIKNDKSRGAVGGPKYTDECVLAHSTDSYRVRFRGGEEACVIVVGDGDTDLDVYVYDENGNQIVKDIDNTDTCVCTWHPRWTGYFTIKVKNLGSVRNYYSLATN